MVDASGVFGGGGLKAGDNSRYQRVDISPVYTSYVASPTVAAATCVTVGDSGTKLYVGDDGVGIEQFTLGTANDITSATPASLALADSNLNSEFILFNPTGTLITYATGSSTVAQRTLSTPWDISSAGGATTTTLTGTNINGATFADSGNSFWIADNSTEQIKEYALGTAYTLPGGTISSPDGTFELDIQGGVLNVNSNGALLVNTTGTELAWIYSDSQTGAARVELSTPWDLSTMSFKSFGLAGGAVINGGNFGCISATWSSDGAKVIQVVGNSTLLSFDLDTAYAASQTIEIVNYTGKALLSDVRVGSSISLNQDSPPVNVSTQMTVYTNIDSAGYRLAAEAEFIENTSDNFSLLAGTPSVGSVAVQSKNSLIASMEARNVVSARVYYKLL